MLQVDGRDALDVDVEEVVDDGDAAGRDEPGDRERGVGREGRRDDGGAREPPGQGPVRCEEGLGRTAGAPGVPGAPAESDGQEEEDDREIEARQEPTPGRVVSGGGPATISRTRPKPRFTRSSNDAKLA